VVAAGARDNNDPYKSRAKPDLTDPTSGANSPFIIGVSGHRDLNPGDLPRLRESVMDFLRLLKEQLADTELRIIIGMAEGADLLVAQAAVDFGLEVDAVLPMPLEHYATDFSPETFLVLRGLLQHPNVQCVHLELTDTVLRARRTSSGPERDHLYANLTETLVRRSSLMLALWDGSASPLPGGTADTVLRYLGIRTDENAASETLEFVAAGADTESDLRAAYWIPAARQGSEPPLANTEPCFLTGFGDNVLQMNRSEPAGLKNSLHLLNRYNRDFAQLSAQGSLGDSESLIASLPTDLHLEDRPALEQISIQYAKADALAMYYQRHSDRLFGLFGGMAFMMGFAYLVYEKLFESPMIIFVYLMILATSFGLYYRLQDKEWFAKHLMCRVIAETMRALFYSRLAGTEDMIDAESVLSLSGIDRFHGFSWISTVLRGIGAFDAHTEKKRAANAARSHFVDQTWIAAQHRYFTAKVAKLEKVTQRIKYLKRVVVAVIISVIITIVLFHHTVEAAAIGTGIPLKNLLTFVMGTLVVLLGVFELHQNKMANRELLWQYRNQLGHFSRTEAHLARITATDRRMQILAELGRESLMENYLWTIHRYHREHEPPAGG
jgi:hypothetical protein